MPDDQREKVVSSAMNIAMSQGGAAAGQNNMMYMWPIIANMVKQNPNVPQVDIMAMAMLGTSPFCLVLSRNFLCIYVKSLSYLHISYNFHIRKWHNMRKFIFGMCLLLLLISILGLTSSQMAPVNKASAAGALDHFVFSNIGTQIAGTAFQITITAADAQSSTVTSYVATNTLSVSTGTISPTSTTSFTRGVWTGQVTLNRAATGVTISTTGSSKSGKATRLP